MFKNAQIVTEIFKTLRNKITSQLEEKMSQISLESI